MIAGMATTSTPAQHNDDSTRVNEHHITTTGSGQIADGKKMTPDDSIAVKVRDRESQPLLETPTLLQNTDETCSMNTAFKEKSPMCLVNELARFNGVPHQYQLVSESGPPHQKTFTVVLKLSDSEEYQASGPSIRKAQHSAASTALTETKLPHPTPKNNKKAPSRSGWPLTPTVELNVLAMRMGQPAEYRVYEPKTTSPYAGHVAGLLSNSIGPYDYRGMYNQRYHYPRGPYTAVVSIGSKQFMGKGKTGQSARHAAADEALKALRHEMPKEHVPVAMEPTEAKSLDDDEDDTKSPISIVHEMALKRNLEVKFDVISEKGPSHMPMFVTRCSIGEDLVTEGEGNGKKVSKKKAAEKMLNELKKLPIQECSQSKLTSRTNGTESKPFPKKNRRNENIVDKTNAQIENNSATKAKKVNLVPQSEILSCVTQLNSELMSLTISGKTSETDSFELRTISTPTASHVLLLHPINRLTELQLSRKDKEPQFKVVLEKAIDRKHSEFTVECTIVSSKGFGNGIQGDSLTATGLGPSKKIAKKKAAEAMLQLLGYSEPGKNEYNLTGEQQSAEPIRRIVQPKEQGADDPVQKRSRNRQINIKLGRQLAPGLLFMPGVEDTIEQEPIARPLSAADSNEGECGSRNNVILDDLEIMELASVMTSEFVATGSSSTAASLLKSSKASDDTIDIPSENVKRPYEQLQVIAQALSPSFRMHLSDFPKLNSSEYLSVITITTGSPRVCHGLGNDIDSARDAAAVEVLDSFATRSKR